MKSVTMDKDKVLKALQTNRDKALAKAGRRWRTLRDRMLADLETYWTATEQGRTELGRLVRVFDEAIRITEPSVDPMVLTREDFEKLIEGKVLDDECRCPICTIRKLIALSSMFGAPRSERKAGLLREQDPESKSSAPAADTETGTKVEAGATAD